MFAFYHNLFWGDVFPSRALNGPENYVYRARAKSVPAPRSQFLYDPDRQNLAE